MSGTFSGGCGTCLHCQAGGCRICPHCARAIHRGLTSAVAIGVVAGALVPMLCMMLMTYLGGGK